jgi:uroporphyrinogen-III synthase
MLGLEVGRRTCARIAPLLGHTVGITGDRRADELATLLQALGATTFHAPVLRTRPDLDDRGELWAATAAIAACPPDYLVATTALGLRTWLNVADTWGLRSELVAALRETRILARGPKVVGALTAVGLPVCFVSPTLRTSALVDQLATRALDGARVAFQVPAAPLDGDPVTRLTAIGANVIEVESYGLTPPEEATAARRLVRAVAQRRVAAVTFTSRAAVQGLLDLADADGLGDTVRRSLRESVVAVAIGAVTADALQARAGVESGVPDQPTLGGVAQTTADRVRARDHRHLRTLSGQDVIVQGRLVQDGDHAVLTSDREAALLDRLLADAGRPVGAETLLRAVWAGEDVDPSVLDTTMTRLRRRLRSTGLTVATMRRRGYVLGGAIVPCDAPART